MFYFFIIALTQNSSKYLCRFFCPHRLKHWGVNTVVLFRLHSFGCNRRLCIGHIAKTRPLNAVIFLSGFPQSGTLTCAYQKLLSLLVCVHKKCHVLGSNCLWKKCLIDSGVYSMFFFAGERYWQCLLIHIWSCPGGYWNHSHLVSFAVCKKIQLCMNECVWKKEKYLILLNKTRRIWWICWS